MTRSSLLTPSELEELVIGRLIRDRQAYWRVADTLRPEFFSQRWAANTYRAIRDVWLASQIPDFEVIVRRLEAMDLDLRPRLLVAMTKAEGSETEVGDLASELVDAYQRRQIERIGNEMVAAAADPEKRPHEVLAAVVERCRDATAADASSEATLSELISGVVKALEDPQPRGVSWGMHTLDEMVGPLLAGDLVVLGGDNGSGKTSAALQVAAHVATTHSVLFFALDQGPRAIAERQAAAWAGMRAQRLRDGQLNEGELDDLMRAAERARDLRLRFVRQSGMTHQDIRLRVLNHARRGGLGLVVVDHLKRIRAPKTRDRMEAIAESVEAMKELAEDAGVPVMLLSQRTRTSQQADDPEPRRDHLFGGGAIEEAADIVLLMWAPAKSKSWCSLRRGESEIDRDSRVNAKKGKVEFILDKHRARDVPHKRLMRFAGDTMTFCEVDE